VFFGFAFGEEAEVADDLWEVGGAANLPLVRAEISRRTSSLAGGRFFEGGDGDIELGLEAALGGVAFYFHGVAAAFAGMNWPVWTPHSGARWRGRWSRSRRLGH